MDNFYQNVNKIELEDKIKAIQAEIEVIEQRIKQLEQGYELPIDSVLLGDCVELMKTLPDNSVDCVVTDPPYSLGKIKSVSKLLQAWLAGEDGRELHSKGFCGAEWDVLPSPRVWKQVLRVLKPGGYALVFAGSRTVDLMGLSLRLAGFEIQDTISHLQGQGFPKGKAQLKPAQEPILMAYKPGNRVLNIDACRINCNWDTDPTQRGWQGRGQTQTSFMAGLNGEVKNKNDLGRHPANVILSHSEDCIPCGTKQIKTGSGSPVINSKKIYVNHLKGLKPIIQHGHHSPDGTETIAVYTCSENCPVRLLDEQTAGMAASKLNLNSTRDKDKPGIYGNGDGYIRKVIGQSISVNDKNTTGNASRFFLNLSPESPFIYQPKASRSDRTINGKVENTHISVKPSNLMAYLVRLVCSPNGIVLDPFMGSGSTALGCIKEGRHYIGMDQNEEYHAIALERIKAYLELSKKL